MSRRYKGVKKLRPDKKLHIALSDLDFSFTKHEIKKVIKMWNKGYNLRVISDELDREGDEIMLLLLDLARSKKIKKRENNIRGWRL